MAEQSEKKLFDRLLKGGAVILVARMIYIGLGFARVTVITRSLGPALRGSFTIFSIIPDLLCSLGSFGFTQAITYFLTRKETPPRLVSGAILIFLLLVSLLLSGVCWGIFQFRYMASSDYQILFDYLPVTLAIIPLSLAGMFYESVLVTRDRSSMVAAIRIVRSSLLLGSFVIFRFTEMDPLPSAIMSLLLSTAAGALLQIVPVIKLGFFPPQFRPSLVLDMFRFGIKGYSTEACELILISMGPLMLSFWSTPSDVGFFSVSMRIADLLTMMPASLVPPLIPILYGARGESLNRFSVTLIKSILLFMFICTIIVFPITQWIMSTVFGSSFLPAGNVLAALLPGYLFYSLYNIFKHYMLSENRGGYLSICAVIAVMLTGIVSFFLIPSLGAVGAAVALSCGMAILIFLLMRRYCLDQKLSFRNLILFNMSELVSIKQGIIGKIRRRVH